ncbi:MAG: gamma carbonic anhydrase family protein [Ignavibacteriales bacterium]|nr:gamma carbonic anhydrase family protein [Ignavibacteriales bacterium]
MKNIIIIPFDGVAPEIEDSVFLAPYVSIIGDVKIGELSSVWFNSVIRGDVNYIRIGKKTNIQDGSILHVSGGTSPLNIGDGVTVGHKACLHGCTVRDFSLIGIGSTVLDNAIVEKNAMVAAGAVVRPGFVVPTGKLAAGVPAKIVRDLTQAEMDYFAVSAEHYAEYALKTKLELEKING